MSPAGVRPLTQPPDREQHLRDFTLLQGAPLTELLVADLEALLDRLIEEYQRHLAVER